MVVTLALKKVQQLILHLYICIHNACLLPPTEYKAGIASLARTEKHQMLRQVIANQSETKSLPTNWMSLQIGYVQHPKIVTSCCGIPGMQETAHQLSLSPV